ncbi:hypothetical protein TruAng_007156 [Truncatella angustata]|nr:hypothetical protein TruAng_007156 [Truncatella angustata]
MAEGSTEKPLGQIQFRTVGNSVPGCGRPGEDFYHWSKAGNSYTRVNIPSGHVFDIFPSTSFTVGRSSEKNIDLICLDHPMISWKHFQLYNVVFEEGNNQSPMVYVRDLQSLNGIFVNGRSISSKSRQPSPGHLLSDGDIIKIEPYWEFEISLFNPKSSPLKDIQYEEAKLFRNRYIITDQILGHGNQGTIHLAVDVNCGKQLACKIMDLDPAGAREEQNHLREVDVLAKTRQPGLLSFEYAFRSVHTIYLFTELATGGDLFSKLASEPLSEKEAKFVAHQIVKCVYYLHDKRDLAHRDIKPENILLASGPGIKTRVIIGDLGHSKATTWGRMTSVVGTNMYQAPELRANHNSNVAHGKSVDIFAIGMTTLTVMIPAARETQLGDMSQKELDRKLQELFGSPTLKTPISTKGQDFIRRCLAVDPNSRMTASQARKHKWICVDKRREESWREIRNFFWKPAHTTTPPVEMLPNVLDEAYLSKPRRPAWLQSFHPALSSSAPLLKRSFEDLEEDDPLKVSLYFPLSKGAVGASSKNGKRRKATFGKGSSDQENLHQS